MEEAPKTRRYPLLVALAGMILLAAIWATMAVAGGSSPAAKPAAKAPAAKTQVSKVQSGYAGFSDGRDCPNKDQGASNDL
jgi:outer membrane murein-binding lipoprotein Lpp